jgi:hypothetical protein
MDDSVTYQVIERRGEAKGRVQEARGLLMRLAGMRLGPPDLNSRAAIDALMDLNQLEDLVARVLIVNSWPELLAGVTPPEN